MATNSSTPSDYQSFLCVESLEERKMLSTVEIFAAGTTGDEIIDLRIDGARVQSFDLAGGDDNLQSYTYTSSSKITADQVRIEFVNDLWDPVRGIDRNVRVDAIVVDGIRYETESPIVFSTGTWLPEDGIQPGFRQDEYLNAEGYFQYDLTGDEVDPVETDGAGFSLEAITGGFFLPTAFAVAEDGRIFVAEKKGVIKVVENGQASTFLDISDEVASVGDRGLLGITLDPDFTTNGHVYYHYTVLDPDGDGITPDVDGDGRVEGVGGAVERVTASVADPNVADMATRVTVLDGHRMTASTHSVGDIDFDNDGNLIFTWGDGGFGDIRLEAQDPNSVQGKVFRIDPVTLQGVAENPFYDAQNPDSVASKVWALGVRNSWTMTVDRETGDVYMGEVTDRGPEEINILRADGSSTLNFGWPYFEGDNPKQAYIDVTPPGFEYESPFLALPHLDLGGGDAITGGAVYRGDVYPDSYDGRYFFGSIVPGMFYTASADGEYQDFGKLGDYAGVTDIQMGSDGHIWMMSLFTGTISRLVYDADAASIVPPTISATQSQSAGVGSVDVQFDASASDALAGESLSYAWDFDSDGNVDSTLANPTTTFTTLGKNVTTLTVTASDTGTSTRSFETTVLAAANPLNIALGKKTTQSTTAFGGLSSRVVDGKLDSEFGQGSTSLTVDTKDAHWEVDLGDIYDISSINIFERTDPSAQPLENFRVFVSETPFSSGNADAIVTDPGVFYRQIADIDESLTVDNLDGSTLARGRYVRISRTELNTNMSLAEVEVFGTLVVEPGEFSFLTDEITIDETAGTAEFTVRRSGGTTGAVTVDYRTVDGTATAGTDYTATSGTLSFADGQATETITIPILSDALTDDSETFSLLLENATGGATINGVTPTQIVDIGRTDYQVTVDAQGNGSVQIDLEARKATPDQTFYVDALATGDQSGTSAANAFLDIDQALKAIKSLKLDAVTVNVAEGTYEWGESNNLGYKLNIIGQGPDKTIVRYAATTDLRATNRYVARLLNDDTYIEGFTFDGTGGTNIAVDVRNVKKLTVVNSHFINAGTGNATAFGDGLNVLNGEDIVVYQSTATGNDNDGFSYSNPKGAPMFVLEAFVNSYGNGPAGEWSSQGSSAHETVDIVRVGSTFADNPTNISDVTSGTTWNVDITSSNAGSDQQGGEFLNYNISGGGTAWIIGGDYSQGDGTPMVVNAQSEATGAQLRYVDQFGTLDPATHIVSGAASVDNSVLLPVGQATATMTITIAEPEVTESELIIYASGDDGRENMTLEIKGVVVKSWEQIGRAQTAFVFRTDEKITASDVRISFTNDRWSPLLGVDYNLNVDRIEIDGVTTETEDPSTFSTATWRPSDGITDGFGRGETLNTGGYFQFNAIEI